MSCFNSAEYAIGLHHRFKVIVMICIILIDPLLLTQETDPERRIKYIFNVGGGGNTVRRQGK